MLPAAPAAALVSLLGFAMMGGNVGLGAMARRVERMGLGLYGFSGVCLALFILIQPLIVLRAPTDPGEGDGYRLPGMPETADASAAAPCMLAQTRAPYAATLGDARMAVQRELPFRQAKAQVVGRFERAYLRGALARHGGNVAQAARAACKHRRAFWALMRKHGIDARPYREGVAGAWPYETAPPRDPADEA
ncbi:transcriptional regulator, Fis domain protein [Bordetella bronchiseptica B18-5 (C3)]|nr:transcriptional regulator, Fis domain protein [Bordetella bronchiseptica B18-5 (C3)]